MLDICYLLLLPVVTSERVGNERVKRRPKGAPYFYDLGIDFVELPGEEKKEKGVRVKIKPQILDGKVWLAECRYRLMRPFNRDAVKRSEAIQTALRKAFFQERNVSEELYEEYTIVLVSNYTMKPERWVAKHRLALAKLIKSMNKPLDVVETEGILESRVRYSAEEMTVVDWDGALIMAKDDFQSDIDLMKTGNYQLLRYRMMDADLVKDLDAIGRLTATTKRSWFPRKNHILHDMVNRRLELITSFEKISQSLLLIGDWYTADLYREIVKELYIDDWKRNVNQKLESLGAVYDIVTANLTFSWERLYNLIDIGGWLVLLIGYFILFFFDIKVG